MTLDEFQILKKQTFQGLFSRITKFRLFHQVACSAKHVKTTFIIEQTATCSFIQQLDEILLVKSDHIKNFCTYNILTYTYKLTHLHVCVHDEMCALVPRCINIFSLSSSQIVHVHTERRVKGCQDSVKVTALRAWYLL